MNIALPSQKALWLKRLVEEEEAVRSSSAVAV
jgi:hypothetical protein